VALSENGSLIDLQEDKNGQNHARLLTVFAEEILKRNQLKTTDIDAVAVSKGPGSYTGLRIGVSAAKGFCYANQIPLIAISTLEAMTDHVIKFVPEKYTLFCPMIDARRMEVYTCLFNEKGQIIQPVTAQIIDPLYLAEELKQSNIVFFGNGAAKCKSTIDHPNAVFLEDVYASAAYMCELAEAAYNNQWFEDVAYFEPFYLKDFIAIASKNNVLGK